jgi:hypothetical protein
VGRLFLICFNCGVLGVVGWVPPDCCFSCETKIHSVDSFLTILASWGIYLFWFFSLLSWLRRCSRSDYRSLALRISYGNRLTFCRYVSLRHLRRFVEVVWIRDGNGLALFRHPLGIVSGRLGIGGGVGCGVISVVIRVGIPASHLIASSALSIIVRRIIIIVVVVVGVVSVGFIIAIPRPEISVSVVHVRIFHGRVVSWYVAHLHLWVCITVIVSLILWVLLLHVSVVWVNAHGHLVVWLYKLSLLWIVGIAILVVNKIVRRKVILSLRVKALLGWLLLDLLLLLFRLTHGRVPHLARRFGDLFGGGLFLRSRRGSIGG